MKHYRIYILIIIITSVVNIIANAQKGLEFGAFVQPQTHWIMNDQDFEAGDELDFRVPYSMGIGINVGYNFSDMLGLRTGLSYDTNGQDYVNNSVDPSINSSIVLNYLKVPVYLKFNTNTQSKLSFLFLAGPQFGLLTKAESFFDEDDPVDQMEQYANFELSAAGALGLQINMDDNSTINFLWRTQYSLNNIEEKVVGRDAYQNLVTGLYIAYNYNLVFR